MATADPLTKKDRLGLKADLSYGAATDRFTTESSQSKRSAPKQKRTSASASFSPFYPQKELALSIRLEFSDCGQDKISLPIGLQKTSMTSAIARAFQVPSVFFFSRLKVWRKALSLLIFRLVLIALGPLSEFHLIGQGAHLHRVFKE
jgi:hypothetical protein